MGPSADAGPSDGQCREPDYGWMSLQKVLFYGGYVEVVGTTSAMSDIITMSSMGLIIESKLDRSQIETSPSLDNTLFRMKKSPSITLLVLAMVSAMALSSCAPRVTSYVESTYDPLPRWEEVTALPEGAEVPAGAERLGEVMVGTAHFVPESQGTLEKERELVKKAARHGGGNLFQITEIREPDEKHRLNRIKADVYRYPFADSLGVTVPRALPGLSNYWVLSVQGGWSYWANKLEGIKDDDNSFRPLYTYGAEVIYMRHGWYGLGLKYVGFHTQPKAKESGQNASFWLLGPAVRYEYALHRVPLSFYATMVFGYMQMNTNVTHSEERWGDGHNYWDDVTEWSMLPSFGMGLEAGMDWHLTEHLSAGLSLSVYRGKFALVQGRSWGSDYVGWLGPGTFVPVGASFALRWAL